MGRSRSRSPSPSRSRPRPRSGSRSRSPNLLLILILLMMVSTCLSAPISSNSISVPFTASFLQYIDHSGVFLTSLNGTFKASISSIQQETQQFYFSIFHSSSTNTMVWTANRNQSISNSDKLSLTSTGLSIITTQSQSHSNQTIWSTPPISSPVTLMQLLDSGNLVLLDKQNITLWQSFDHPTDTLVINQPLLVRHSLDATATKDANLSVGDYSLLVTTGDAILQWNNITYWKLSMETSAFKDSNIPAHSLQLNHTGLYLLADDESTAVIQLIFHQSAYRIANLRYDGKFVITRFLNNTQTQDFSMPLDTCRIPSFCGKYGLCSNGACSCLPGFHTNNNGDCVPTDASLTMPNACLSPQNQTQTSSPISYLRLRDGVDYFANSYSESVNYGVNLTSCQDLCMKNCSCLGMFYDGGSDSCYFILNYVGSFIQTTDSDPDRSGYIKVVIVSSPAFSQNDAFPRAGLILIPLFGFILVLAASILGFVYCRKKRLSRMCIVKLGSRNSFADELENFSIAGLPVRFDYQALSAATDNFKNQIGKGGFGTVYKGTLPDKTAIAVKKITSLGVQGNKEFCTEIAIIGQIHHVNLVRLKGFCAVGRGQRFLVLEFMDRGSLDATLFGNTGPILEWRERFEIALGTARGLAYLHSGCEHKIIHCDIKPENILLHQNLQVKLSDFGLSKLLTPEQSSLFTTMRGTRGYLAPEWLTNSSITDKTDVYSYGMVLLEIIRGYRNCASENERPDTDSSISSRSRGTSTRSVYFPLLALAMHEQRRYTEVADPRLQGRVTITEVEKLVRIALCCIHQEPGMRPSMSNVVSMLEGGMGLTEPLLEQLHHLSFYGQRFTEESTMGESGEQMDNKLALFPAESNNYNTTATSSLYTLSFISTDKLSGPR